jgi:membrane associated rhomboid family serine protease
MDFDLLMHVPATLALMATNIIVSIAAFNNMRLIDAMLFDIGRIRRNHEYYRMITSGFIHGDPFHLILNMYSLFIFGPYLESFIGAWTFLGLYMACLLAGSLWTFMDHYRNTNYRALGASGAVSGVTSAIALFAPFSQILAFFIVPMPLILFALLFILFSAYASRNVRDGVGHSAHLGGALMGVALVCLFWPQAVRFAWDQVLTRFPH